jgi:hypothetical protein
MKYLNRWIALSVLTILISAAAATVTIRGLAANAFGTYDGQFNTVASYSNGAPGNYYPTLKNYVNGYYTGVEWQCVEYIRRFYYTIFNTQFSSTTASDAGQWYGAAAALGLTAYPNGQTTTAPQVGDILCSTTHVAIIKRVVGGYVYTAQQNVSEDSNDLDRQMTLTKSSDGKYTIGGGPGTIQGWLRKPIAAGQAGSYWHPDGSTLVDSHGTVWLIENGKRRGIPSDWVFASNGLTWYRLINATDQELSCIPVDTNLPDGSTRQIVKSSNGTIYLITDKGYKRGFVSADVFTGLGYSWKEVVSISDYDLSTHPDDPVAPVLTSPLPDGTLVTGSGGDGTIYVITDGKKRGITSASAFTLLGYDWNRIVTIPLSTLNNIGTGTPIDDNQVSQCRPY